MHITLRHQLPDIGLSHSEVMRTVPGAA